MTMELPIESFLGVMTRLTTHESDGFREEKEEENELTKLIEIGHNRLNFQHG